MRIAPTLVALLLGSTAQAGVISAGDNSFPAGPDQFRIGLDGVGSWTIDSGSVVTMRGNAANIGLVPFTIAEPFLIVGRRPGSNGTVLIDGPGSRLAIVGVGANPPAPDFDGAGLAIGRQGTGTMTVRNGATLAVSDAAGAAGSGARAGEVLQVGRDPGGVGVLRVDGATVSVEGSGAFMQIGRNGGRGTVEFTNRATAIVRNLTSDGSVDSANVSVGGVQAGNDAVGAVGALLLSDSRMTIDGGRGFAGLFAGRDTTRATGNVVIRGAEARLDLVSTSNSGIVIGRDATSTGTLRVADGAVIDFGTPAIASLAIGRDAGAQGDVLISGGASIDMRRAGDSDVTVAFANANRPNAGRATLDIVGAGSALRVVDQVLIGAPTSLGGTTGDGTVTVRGGGLLSARQVTVGTGGTLRGDGTVAANVLVDGGVVLPGLSPGLLTVQGDFTLATGRVRFEIAGSGADQHDMIDIAGALVLAGGVVEVAFIDSFVPALGESFTLFDADLGLTSDTATRFDTLGLPAGLALSFQIGAGGTVVALVERGADPVSAPGTLALLVTAGATLARIRRRSAA